MKIFPHNKKRKEIRISFLIYIFLAYIWNSILKKVSFSLKHFYILVLKNKNYSIISTNNSSWNTIKFNFPRWNMCDIKKLALRRTERV